MGDDAVLRQFDDIEGKVEDLIGLCSSLKEDNIALNSRVVELEQEINKKNEIEKLNAKQKEIVRNKIDNLLERLKKFTELTP